MMLNTGQALKFVEISSKGHHKTYFETLLGNSRMPSVSDFNSDDADAHERAECLLDLLQVIVKELTNHLSIQPRQLDFTKTQPTQTMNQGFTINCNDLHPDTPPPRSGKGKGGSTKKKTSTKNTTSKKKPTKKKGKS